MLCTSQFMPGLNVLNRAARSAAVPPVSPPVIAKTFIMGRAAVGVHTRPAAVLVHSSPHVPKMPPMKPPYSYSISMGTSSKAMDMNMNCRPYDATRAIRQSP